jgi:two-component sensor histidine kinase
VAARQSCGEVNMRLGNLNRDLTTKHSIDFSLVPIAIVLIEFSVFITQLSEETYSSLSNLISLRILHTIVMITTAFLVSQTYIRTGRSTLNFRTLAITGVCVMGFGDVTHALLASIFDIELVSFYRRIGIVLIQGSLWFPAFLIIGGNRKEIIHQFKEYEKRLVIATRASSRTSPDFKVVQEDIQSHIRRDFYAACAALKDLITKPAQSNLSLPEQYAAIQPHLTGERLRNLSRELERSTTSSASQNLFEKKASNVRFFFQEFKYLYATITQSSPLRARAYVFVLLALVTPPYINFYSLKEFLFSYPILVLLIVAASKLIVKAQSGSKSAAIKNGSILIAITGLLPTAINLVGQAINHDPRTQFPLLITVFLLPIAYYMCMEFFQVLRPSALSLVRKDKLKASEALKTKVRKAAIDDYSQYLYQQWATFIHGKILTRFAATSLKLKEASIAGDSQSFNQTLQSLLSLLSKPDADFEEESRDLQTEVTSRLAPWRGLLEITVHIEPELNSLRNARVKSIGEVIEELISNSIRHGKAKKIDLRVNRSNGKDIEIVAIDNAVIPPPKTQVEFGLGTRIFNLVSDGRWSITRIGLFTEFRLMMAIDSQEE